MHESSFQQPEPVQIFSQDRQNQRRLNHRVTNLICLRKGYEQGASCF